MKAAFILSIASPLLALAASAQVVITEIHYHPVELPTFNADGTPVLDLSEDIHEFVEIQNAGLSAVDLTGWGLSGGVRFSFPSGATLPPGGFQVVARDPARLAKVYSLPVAQVSGPYVGTLGNTADSVRVRDASGRLVDSVSYSSRFPWAQSADALGAEDRFTGLDSTNHQYRGRSLQRVSVTWASGDPANWVASPISGPTPGSAQSAIRLVPKPVVVAFSASQTLDGASVVRSGNSVTVNCTYSGTNGLSQSTLEYFVDDINSTGESRASVAMTDLGEGRFVAVIPGQADRSIVRYRFRANRGDGLETVSPRSDDPQIAPVGAGGALEAWHGYFVTPVRTSANPAVYDVFISTAGLATMAANVTQNPKRATAATAAGLPRDTPYVVATAPQWNGTVAGILAHDGELWDIQIRYHGSRYHRAPSNLSYKLHFPDHHPLNNQSSWFETLHGAEFIEAQRLNRLIGLPASRMRSVDWYLNSAANNVHSEQGEYAGEMLADYHELQQQLNPGAAKEASGELYKDVGNRDASQNNAEGPYTRGDVAPMLANSRWTQLDRYDWTYTLQNHGWKGPKPIRDLIEGMWAARGDTPATHNFSANATALANARAWFTNNWDIDTTLTSMALLEWMSIWDDAAQNHFFWRRADGKWSRLGWDYDGVMASTTGGGGPGGGLGGGSSQTIFGGESGATTVFDGVNWWKDTFYKCFRSEYQCRLWEINNSFCDPTNLTALGFTRAATFAKARQVYVNTQLASLGTYSKPARPVNQFPASNASIVSVTNLVGGAYSHPGSIARGATRWEIRSASGDYEQPVLRVTSTEFLTSFPIPFDQLIYGQTYYWRVTYLDINGHPSVVSAETSFTWGAASSTAGALVLNEILAYNRTGVQNGTDFPDYIELRNNGSLALDISGYGISDNPLNPAKYVLPAGTVLEPGAYLVLWCDKAFTEPGLHTGFGLNEEGETVLLVNGGGIVDSVSFGPQAPDVSVGRIANGTGGWQANTPTAGAPNVSRALDNVRGLRINEWMASPAYGEDWLEIHNPASNVVAIAGLYLGDSPASPSSTRIPPLSFIAGGGFTRFRVDGSASGGSHLGFKLSAGGDTIVLTAANGATPIDTVTFGPQEADVSQGRLPDGSPNILSFPSQTSSPGYRNWSPSSVYINEILANARLPFEDAIELHNSTAAAVDIGGWWLSDDLLTPRKYQVPSGTVIPAGGYRVFYESALAVGAVPFALNARGDEVLLSAVDASGALTGLGSMARFGASLENTSFGRVEARGLNASSGSVEFWPLEEHTFGQDSPATVAAFRTGSGALNASPRIGPVIINEVHYHPPDAAGGADDTAHEYVELWNISADAVNLEGWRFKGDAEFLFPAGVVLPAGGLLMLVGFDPADPVLLASFRSHFGLASTVPVFGPYSERLANNTFDLELAYPASIGGSIAYVNVDKIEYRDLPPWDAAADGGGKSLQRVSLAEIGNSVANWVAAPPTPGAINLAVRVSSLRISTGSALPDAVVGVPYAVTFLAAGTAGSAVWTISSGSVPGLELSSGGVLQGTPTLAGQQSLTLRVTDATGSSAIKTFELFTASKTTSPLITLEEWSGTSLVLSIMGSPGLRYTVESSGDLIGWIPVFSTNAPPLPFRWTAARSMEDGRSFYRVRAE